MHPVTETLTRETAAALLSLLTVAETPARAPRFAVGQRLRAEWPTLNKRCTLAEYREQSDRTVDLCQVARVLELPRAEFFAFTEALMNNRADLGTGGHDSDADLPANWDYFTGTEEEREAFRAQAYRLVTVVLLQGAEDDRETFLVDAQGYTYARYVGFLCGAARPRLRLVPPPAPEPEPAPVVEVPALSPEAAALAAPAAILSIEAARIPTAPLAQNARRADQKERTRLIRQALKDAGVRGASVTMARGSMCYWSDIRVEGIAHTEYPEDHVPFRCPVCQRNQAAEKKLNAIIMAALPGMDDRSDSQSDHFDFVYSVNVSSHA